MNGKTQKRKRKRTQEPTLERKRARVRVRTAVDNHEEEVFGAMIPELLREIASYLDSCGSRLYMAYVCRHWQRALRQSPITYKVALDDAKCVTAEQWEKWSLGKNLPLYGPIVFNDGCCNPDLYLSLIDLKDQYRIPYVFTFRERLGASVKNMFRGGRNLTIADFIHPRHEKDRIHVTLTRENDDSAVVQAVRRSAIVWEMKCCPRVSICGEGAIMDIVRVALTDDVRIADVLALAARTMASPECPFWQSLKVNVGDTDADAHTASWCRLMEGIDAEVLLQLHWWITRHYYLPRVRTRQ